MLHAKGYEAFLPTYRTSYYTHGKLLHNERVLFPGYVFCNLAPGANGHIVTTPGVVRIVSCGGIPSLVPDSEIARIRAVVESRFPAYPCPHLQPGTNVVVTAGPLKGVYGTLVRIKNMSRLVVSVHLLRQAAAVELDIHSVASVIEVQTSPEPCTLDLAS
jgi:transcription antitermination factor NusG